MLCESVLDYVNILSSKQVAEIWQGLRENKLTNKQRKIHF
jgi:hypothetical protein